jgi:carbon monoxide dehydrogenase subunit G
VRIAGNYTFEATREEVWSALNDPEVLARTIPGCQRLDQVGENEYESTLKVGLQAVRGTYNGRVKIDNLVAPESYDIHVDGKGSNGFLKGSGSIKLRTDGAHTILDYGGEAQVGGTIASVGQRLLDGAAKTLISQSLKALAQQIEDRRLHVSAHTAEVLHAVADEVVHAAAPGSMPAADSGTAAAVAEAPASAVVEQPTAPSFERRTITVPPGQGLSEADLARGAAEDFVKERPWLPWVLVAFLIGYLLGKRP